MKFAIFYVLAVLAILVGGATAAPPGKIAVGKPANRVEYLYLNAVGIVVGSKVYHCSGEITQWGTTGTLQETIFVACE